MVRGVGLADQQLPRYIHAVQGYHARFEGIGIIEPPEFVYDLQHDEPRFWALRAIRASKGEGAWFVIPR
jgi:hypothetical protein